MEQNKNNSNNDKKPIHESWSYFDSFEIDWPVKSKKENKPWENISLDLRDKNQISDVDTVSQFQQDDKENFSQINNKKKKTFGIISEIAIYLALLVLCIYIIPTYVMQRTIVDGPSMERTLYSGDNLVVEKISYRLNKLKRFDIIAFYPNGKEASDYYVKRIIGLPGETIQILNSIIYINGKPLSEDFGYGQETESGIAEEPITLSEDEFFVLGDNREVSEDSRSSLVGVVKKENIGGKAILRIYPFYKFGLIE